MAKQKPQDVDPVVGSVPIKINPRHYLRWPRSTGAPVYQAGEVVRVPEADAEALCTSADGTPPLATRLSEV